MPYDGCMMDKNNFRIKIKSMNCRLNCLILLTHLLPRATSFCLESNLLFLNLQFWARWTKIFRKWRGIFILKQLISRGHNAIIGDKMMGSLKKYVYLTKYVQICTDILRLCKDKNKNRYKVNTFVAKKLNNNFVTF